MPSCVWLSVFMEQLLKVGELERQELVEQDSLILLSISIIALIIPLDTHANVCFLPYPLIYLWHFY